MKIVMTGSSGLIGRALMPALQAAGHQIVPLVRRDPAPKGSVSWNPLADTLDLAPLAGAGAVIHLAAEGIADGRWTAAKKKRVTESRVRGTNLIARSISMLNPNPMVLLCTSAVGYYGDRGDEELAEDSPP